MPAEGVAQWGERPRAIDLLSGKRAWVVCALSRCGWRVRIVDYLLEPDEDLADKKAQREMSNEGEKCNAQFWAPGCPTLSRAREKSTQGQPNAPRPLRAEGRVRGLRNLCVSEAARVGEANSHIDFAWSKSKEAVERNCAVGGRS